MDTLLVEGLAASASLFFAVAVVVVKAGLQDSNSLSAFTVEVIVSAAFFAALLPISGVPSKIPLEGIFWLIVGGVTGSFVARLLQIDAIDKMGAALAAPLSNISSLFSSVMAVLLLSEPITGYIAAGTLVTVAGMFALSYQRGKTSWRQAYVLVPIGASLFFGIGSVTRKHSLAFIHNLYFASAVTAFAALGGLVLFMAISGSYRSIRLKRRNVVFFSVAGLSYSAATIALFGALKSGLVVIVGPIAGTVPLFVLVLAALFLRDLERLNVQVILGAVVVVLGIALLSL